MDKNGFAIASLVLGILSVVAGMRLFLMGVLLVFLAIIFGFIGLKKSHELNHGRGMAIAGIILGFVFLILFILLFAFAIRQNNANFEPFPTLVFFGTPFVNDDLGILSAENFSIIIPFGNYLGEPFTIHAVGSTNLNGCQNPPLIVVDTSGNNIPSGQVIQEKQFFTVIWDCPGSVKRHWSVDGMHLRFNYTIASTNTTKSHNGVISGTFV